MTGRDPVAGARQAPRWRDAFRLGIINGILFGLGSAFVDPSTVLPLFVRRITDSDFAVGMLSTVAAAGSLLPQLAAANYLEASPRKLPLYIRTAIIRTLGWPAIVLLLMLLLPAHPVGALYGFFAVYAIIALASGLASLSFLDVVAKAVPLNRLGAFWGWRQFVGGLLAVGAGFFVRAVLSDGAFPGPYLILFGLTGATYVLALGSFSLVAEPPGPSASKRTPLARYLRRAPGLFRTDRLLRDAFISRALIGCSALAGPFYIIYCKNRLGSPDSLAGAYLAAINAGIIIVNLAWARIADRHGAAPLIRAVAITTFLGPALALLIAVLPLSNLAAQNAFFAVFFLIGAAGSGGFAFNNYLMEIAPEEQRPRYFGTMNTFFAFITLLPALGGLLAEATSYQVLFAVSAALTLAGFWTCRRLRPRDA